MWEWLSSLSGGAATFIGSLTGSAIGLIALLIGALFNAHLNRRRDDRLREIDTRGLAVALLAELRGICTTLKSGAADFEKGESGTDFAAPDLTHMVRIFPEMVQKLNLLDVETISDVVDAYGMVEQYTQMCTLLDCKIDATTIPGRRLLKIPNSAAAGIAKLNRHTVEVIEPAITKLNSYLR